MLLRRVDRGHRVVIGDRLTTPSPRSTAEGRGQEEPQASQAAGASRIARTTDPAAPTTVAVVPSAAARTVTGAHAEVTVRLRISRETGVANHGANGAKMPPSTTVSTSTRFTTSAAATP